MTDTTNNPDTGTLISHLQTLGVGITNPAITQRLADVLTTAGFTADTLPSSAHGDAVCNLFTQLTPAERIELGEALALNTGHDVDNKGWPDWLTKQLTQAEHDDEIARTRDKFNTQLTDTLHAMRRLQATRRELIDLHDGDMAECGELFPHHLDQADIALRTAAALNPVKER